MLVFSDAGDMYVKRLFYGCLFTDPEEGIRLIQHYSAFAIFACPTANSRKI